MTREQQLQYCKICRNQSFSFDHGIICRLTNEQAAFQTECEHFEADPVLAGKQQLREREKQQKQKGRFYPTSQYTPIAPYNGREAQFRNARWPLGIGAVMALGLGPYLLYTAITEPTMNNRWFMYVFSLVIIAGFIFFTLQFFDRTIKLAINHQGVVIEAELYEWSSIADTVIHTIPQQKGDVDYLILHLTDGTEKKIEIASLEGSPRIIGGTIEYFRQISDNKA